jgi:hypothetical protein
LDLKKKSEIDKEGELKSFIKVVENTWELNLRAISGLLSKEIDEKTL